MRLLRSPVRSLLLHGCLAGVVSAPLYSQTAVPDASGRLVFKANARTVLVDVVVTGRDGNCVPGLRKEDFNLTEDGHPQQIAYFEEHKGSGQTLTTLPDLPPNVFTNVPRVKPVDSVTVLLLDSLNTQLPDQPALRSKMLNYLAGIKPGQRLAIFTLGNQLRFIQGFTSDPAVLVAALNRPHSGTGPQASPLLRSNAQESAEQTALAEIAEAQAASPSFIFQQALQRLQQYQAETQAFQNDQRVRITLDALQQLGRYLAGIPGRKNVIWFSSAFPLNLLPNPELSDSFSVLRDYQEMIRTTDYLLGAAEVAIYPVAADGLGTDLLYGADQHFTGYTTAPQPNQPQEPTVQSFGEQALHVETNHLRDESTERIAGHASMDQIARETGGEAFYNTNGLQEALDKVADHGSRYYSFAYNPTNTAADGRFRKLQVKLVAGHDPSHDRSLDTSRDIGGYKLAYRQGYFASPSKEKAAAKANNDPLHPFMGPGMPESTQILFAMRVKPGGTPSGSDAGGPEIVKHYTPITDNWGRVSMESHTELQPGEVPDHPLHAGDNPRLKGKLTRYTVDFVIAAQGLQLSESADGRRRGAFEATLILYDRDGKPVNWLVRQLELDMDAARYAQSRQTGISFQVEIDAPKDSVSLRSGIYDPATSLAGTLEVPLQSVLVGQAPGLKPR